MKAIIVYRELGNVISTRLCKYVDEEIQNGIYNNISYDDLINEIIENQGSAPVFSLSREFIGESCVYAYIPLTVSGKTYAKRKADLQNKAIEWSYASGVGAWSYGELSTIQEFFEVNGKRYGLLNEFKENGII